MTVNQKKFPPCFADLENAEIVAIAVAVGVGVPGGDRGIELVVVVPPLLWWRERRRRRKA